MSHFRSFLERTHLRPFVLLLAAIGVFFGIPVIGRALPESVSVSSLPTALSTALSKLGALVDASLLSSLLHILTCVLNTAPLRVRIHLHVPIQWRQMLRQGLDRPRADDTYPTPHAEAKYWRITDRYRRRLYSGNGATFTPPSALQKDTIIPLVTYYAPRLLPLYRDRSGGKRTSRGMDVDAHAPRVSPKTFCKWHRMVFQDARHPTLAQAAMQMKYYSNRDLHEMRRIARLLPDEQVFGAKADGSQKAKQTTKYKEMWKHWLENKGMDLVIVFE